METMSDPTPESPPVPTATPQVSVIVVSYNTVEMTRACLRSVYETTGGIDFEIIVLDNASADGSASMIATEFPGIRLLALDDNLGFARGVNRAAAESSGDYLLLLNPDTVVHDGAIEHLFRFAGTRPKNGIYGGRTLRPDGALEPSSCWDLPSPWSLFCFATGLSTAFHRNRLFDPESLGRWPRDTVREVGLVTGCLMLIDRRLWVDLGGFDPRFFMYAEEADLCIRAAGRGWQPIITPGATVMHAVGGSSTNKARATAWVLKGKATLLRKHWSPPRRQFGLAMLWAGSGLRSSLAKVATRTGRRGGVWPEVWESRHDWLPGYPPAPGP